MKADQKDRMSNKNDRNKNESATTKSRLNDETNITIAQYLLEKANNNNNIRMNNNSSRSSQQGLGSNTSNAGARLVNIIPSCPQSSIEKKRNQNNNNSKNDDGNDGWRTVVNNNLQQNAAVENGKKMKTSRDSTNQSYLLPPKQ